MNVQHTPTAMTENREQHSYAPLYGRWLLLARGLWITLVVLTLAIFFASLPVYLAQLQTPCAGSACQYQQLTAVQGETLKGMGLSLGDYAAYTVALMLASVVLCLVVSTLIVWRRSDDRMALIGTRWTLVVFVAAQVPLTFLPVAPLIPNTSVSQLGWLVAVSEMAIVALVQLYRYRRVSSPLQRQQTKWVVFGLAVPITVLVGVTVLGLLFPVLAERSSLYLLAFNEVGFLLPLFLPLSFGFAMLRSRLWDIDVLINRTLVYGALTVILTGIYVGLVIGLQALLRSLIIQDNSGAIILSTLAIAALFQPVRKRIQALIDRRFYRKKYDAEKTLAAFNSTLRQEVDLDQLCEQLLAVVQEVMQPAHVSLWLRKSEQAGKYRALPAYTALPTQDHHEHEHLSDDDEPRTDPWLTEREQ